MKLGKSKLNLLQLEYPSHSEERHDHAEGLFVARGQMNLTVDGQTIAVNEGAWYVVPPGALHTVEPVGNGTVVVFE